MQIRALRVRNFRGIDDLQISFTDRLGRVRPITVIAGPNGSGKTSILFSIVQALRGVMGYQTDDVPEPSDFDVRTSAGTASLSPEPIQICVSVDVEFDQVERAAIPRIFEDTADIRPTPETLPDLPSGRITAEWQYPPARLPDGTQKPTWYLSRTTPRDAIPWFHGYRHMILGWRRRKLRSRDLREQVGGLYLFPQDRGLRDRVVGRLDDATTDITDLVTETDEREERRQGRRGGSDVHGILKYLSEFGRAARLEPDTLADTWEQRVKETFNRICHPKEYLGFMYHRDAPTGAPYFRDSDNLYPLHMASSGEQVIIEYITRLSYPSPLNHSIVLIDEPELHLHPGWIRRLYAALPKIGVGNQYIMTTHSQELRSMAAADATLLVLGELDTVTTP